MNNPHKNARTTLYNRVLIVERVTQQSQPVRRVAQDFGISPRTVYKWLARFREAGIDGLQSASSRPLNSPNQLSQQWAELIANMWRTLRWTARKIANTLKIAYSTVTAELRRQKLSRIRDRQTDTSISSLATCCTWTSNSSHALTALDTA